MVNRAGRKKGNEPTERPWTFLSNYAHVLLCLASNPQVRLRDVAADVGITERAATRLVNHLAEAGIVTKNRVGRRNQYEINTDEPLRHPLEMHSTVGALLDTLMFADRLK